MSLFIIWVVMAVLVGVWASNRGRGGYGWFVLACLISPLLAGLVLAVSTNLATSPQLAVPTETSHIRCPMCAEFVLPEAVKCKHCSAALKPDLEFHQRRVAATATTKNEDSKNLKIGIGFIVFVIFAAWLIDRS